MAHIFKLVAATLVLCAGAQALENSFLGCYTDPSAGGLVDGTSSVGTTEDCAAYCAGAVPQTPPAFTYSYYYANDLGPRCDCYTVHPVYAFIDSSTTTANVCENPASSSVYRIETAFAFNGCYNEDVSSARSIEAGNNGDCFALCGTSTNVGHIATNGQTGKCLCDIANPTTSPITCDSAQTFYYSRSAAAAASGITRRNQRIARLSARASMAKNKFCPAKHLACVVPGSDSYECIDVSSELESCGGCVHGVFGETSAAATGIDCSSLPGAPMGSYSCSSGTCQAAVCEKGWELGASGICV